MFSNDLQRYGPQAVPTEPLTLRRAAAIAGGWPGGTTRTSPSPAGSCRVACGSTSATSTPIAAGPTTWPTRSATPSAASPCWIGGKRQLRDCYEGRAVHPVFIALGETIRQFNIPREPFADLLVAFRQDQRVTRYETIDQLLEYCRYSANPVGRLVLYLGGCHTPERTRLADSICTGLQLANFCQDVARDWDRGRIYLPQAVCRRFGCDEASFARREPNDAFRRLLADQVEQAEGWLRRGLPLAATMPPGLRLPVALFVQGGLATLEAIRRQNYDVWTRRPTVSKWEKLRLVIGCWWKIAMTLSRDALETSYDYCRRVSRRAGSNFHMGFLLLPREKRRAMEALYAFMRHTDDLADDLTPDRPRRDALAAWRAALEDAIGHKGEGGRGKGKEQYGVRSTKSEVGKRRWSTNLARTPYSVSVHSPFRHPARPGRRRPAVPHSRGASLRGDRRRGDGPGLPSLRDVRRVAAVLPARGVGRRAGVHLHLGIPRAGGVRAGTQGGHRPATDQYPPRPEGQTPLPAASTCRWPICGRAITPWMTCRQAWPTSDSIG